MHCNGGYLQECGCQCQHINIYFLVIPLLTLALTSEFNSLSLSLTSWIFPLQWWLLAGVRVSVPAYESGSVQGDTQPGPRLFIVGIEHCQPDHPDHHDHPDRPWTLTILTTKTTLTTLTILTLTKKGVQNCDVREVLHSIDVIWHSPLLLPLMTQMQLSGGEKQATRSKLQLRWLDWMLTIEQQTKPIEAKQKLREMGGYCLIKFGSFR